MSAVCSPDYVLKFCDCLPDPITPGRTICGYINRMNGLVYPCDIGCCPGCPNQGTQPSPKVEVRKGASTLPKGFGDAMVYSSSGTDIPGAAPFVQTETTETKEPRTIQTIITGEPYKVWHIFLVFFMLLSVVLVLA